MNVYLVGSLAVLFNFILWFTMFFTQTWESKTGRIPARKKHNRQNPENSFLYIQDFWTNGPFGDLIGISLVDISVAVTIYQTFFSIWMIIPLPVVIFLVFKFYKNCTKPKHKPDWGYLKTGITWGGRTHLGYTVLQGMVIAFGLIFLVLSKMTGIFLAMFFGGFAVWVIGFFIDKKTGRFAPLKQ